MRLRGSSGSPKPRNVKRYDIRDESIGNLPWNEQHECWGGCIDVSGRSIPLTVMPSAQSEPPIEFLRSLVAVLRREDGRLPQSAADELLDACNDDWRIGR